MKTIIKIFSVIAILTIAFTSNATTFKIPDGNQSDIKVTGVRMSKIKENQAECNYKVEGKVTEKGVCYSDTPAPTVNHKKVVSTANSGSTITSGLPGLKEGTKYFIRAYAKNGTEIIYGAENSFTTLPKGGDSKPTTGPKNEPKPEAPKK